MIRHLLLISFRTLKAKGLYSVVNLLGLSLSLGVASFVYLFIKDELTFDRFHQNADKIYRLESNVQMPSDGETTRYWRVPALPDPLIEKIRSEIPEIERSTRFLKGFRNEIIYVNDNAFSERITYVDGDFFEMFSFNQLNHQKSISTFTGAVVVISESVAKKYFINSDPIGKVISIGETNKKPHTVVGVLETPPGNSSISFEILVPLNSWENYEQYRNSRNEFSYAFFIQVSPNTRGEDLNEQLKRLVNNSSGELLRQGESFELSQTPLTGLHWNTDIPWENSTNSQNVKILIAIVLMILGMACANFIAISMIISTRRRVEVGIRKLFGADKKKLVLLFITESAIYVAISTLVSIVSVYLLLPSFNNLIDKKILFFTDSWDLIFFLSIIVSVSILAGSYPSFFLSSLNTATILKSQFVLKFRSSMISVFVIFQFTLSLFFWMCSLVMTKQMHYVNSRALGYDESQVLILPIHTRGSEARQILEKFKTLAQKEKSIVSITSSSLPFFEGLSSMGVFTGSTPISARCYVVDTDFITTLGIQIVNGRDFNSLNPADSQAVIINQRLAESIAEKPVGEVLKWGLDQTSNIIGVVKDFHFRSLNYSIEPMFLTMSKNAGQPSVMLVKIAPTKVGETLKTVKALYELSNPNKPFEFRFLNEDVQKQYKPYKMWTTIISLSNAFTTFIACIGLFALTGINASNHYKEIAIRKVFGATVAGIITEFTKRYLILILISSAIGMLCSYFAMSEWLDNFSYQIEINWQVYFYGILFGFAITLISVGYHSIRAALINPVNPLKNVE